MIELNRNLESTVRMIHGKLDALGQMMVDDRRSDFFGWGQQMLTQTDKNKIVLAEWTLELIHDQVPKTIDEFVKIGAIQIPTNQDAAPIVIVKEGFDDLARALGIEVKDFYGIKGCCRGFLFAGQAVMFLEGDEATIGTEK